MEIGKAFTRTFNLFRRRPRSGEEIHQFDKTKDFEYAFFGMSDCMGDGEQPFLYRKLVTEF